MRGLLFMTVIPKTHLFAMAAVGSYDEDIFL